jgi:hypothetical protein
MRKRLIGTLQSALAAALVAAAADGQLIRVPEDHPTVASAVAAAPDGAEIRIAAGTWDVRDISLTGAGRTLTISGAGDSQTTLSGGGVSRAFRVLDGAKLTVQDLCIRDCRSIGSSGGAFVVGSGFLYVSRCLLRDNRAEGHGGVLMVDGSGEVCIFRSTLLANGTDQPGCDGGAIFAGFGGCRLTLESCVFKDNFSTYHAGAVAAFTLCRFNNCVFERNSSSYGGAIRTYHVGNMLTFTHCTFLDNTGYGSAIFSYYGDIRLVNCALRGPGSLLEAVYGGRFHGAGCVMSSGSLDGYGNVTADPQIGPDYVPLPTSPCIDAGVAQIIATPWSWGGAASPCAVVEQDLRGNPRWLDHPGFPNTGCHIPRAAIDVGAVELGGVVVRPALPADINDDEAVDGDDLGRLLAAWGLPDCASDLNADGVVDGTDLGFLLSRWGGCHGQF